MAIDLQIVVSSENSPYIAWQTQLFCFSSLTRMAVYPTVVVHRAAAPLLPEFEIMRSWGCQIVEAPQFRKHPVGDYPPRNEIGTLVTIAGLPQFGHGYILFCEPDMLFVNRPPYIEGLRAEHYSYLNYTEKRISDVAQTLGLADKLHALNQNSGIGVPYLIPAEELRPIANRWIDVLDLFEEIEWIDIMYAFGLALAVEGLSVEATHFMTHNQDPLKKLDSNIIHYCYGDWRWSKRAFTDGRSPLVSAPMPSVKHLSGTILGEILTQVQQARIYSRFPRLFNCAWGLGGTFAPWRKSTKREGN
jgi:hypothetical protein